MKDSEKIAGLLGGLPNTLLDSSVIYSKLLSITCDFAHVCTKHGLENFHICWIGGDVEKITGYSSEEIYTYGCWLNIVHPEDIQIVSTHLMNIKAGDTGNIEFRIIHKNGTPIWVKEHYGCEACESTGNINLYGSIRDITEHKHSEELLCKSEEKFRTIFERAPMGILIHNHAGVVLECNKHFADIFGTKKEQYKGINLMEVLPEGILRDTLVGVISDGKFRHTECSYASVFTGKQLEIGLSTAMLAPELFIAFIEDITSRKRMEEVMIQTEKMMSVGGLAAGMAHEINNPLSGILQGSQVISNRLKLNSPASLKAAQDAGIKPDNLREFLQIRGITDMIVAIRESAIRATNIVASMLEFSRASTKNSTRTDLNLLLDKAVELCATDYDLKKKYDFRNIQIIKNYSTALPLVVCSDTQIQQVFINLLANSAQAMAATPSPTIVLSTAVSGDWARIEIQDNGPGMNEDLRKRAFEPFFTTKPVGEGTGLGLSVSYFIIVNNHHGSIELNSQPGRGARFVIRLPLSQTPNATSDGF
jgi:polar amino acid transport system substrate-binding protein